MTIRPLPDGCSQLDRGSVGRGRLASQQRGALPSRGGAFPGPGGPTTTGRGWPREESGWRSRQDGVTVEPSGFAPGLPGSVVSPGGRAHPLAGLLDHSPLLALDGRGRESHRDSEKSHPGGSSHAVGGWRRHVPDVAHNASGSGCHPSSFARHETGWGNQPRWLAEPTPRTGNPSLPTGNFRGLRVIQAEKHARLEKIEVEVHKTATSLTVRVGTTRLVRALPERPPLVRPERKPTCPASPSSRAPRDPTSSSGSSSTSSRGSRQRSQKRRRSISGAPPTHGTSSWPLSRRSATCS